MKEFVFKMYYYVTFPINAVCVLLILLYRGVLRYSLVRKCNFLPSCSKYALDSFIEFGFLLGGILTIKRVLKCNPNHKGGIDYPKLNLLGNYKWKC